MANSDSYSAYDPKSSYYNPYALGNRPFFIPSGYSGGQGTSPIGSAIGSASGYYPYQQGGYYAPGGGGYGQYSMSAPGATGMDPRYFSAYWAPSQLTQQQYGLSESAIAGALSRLPSVLKTLGFPTTAEGTMEEAERAAALEAEPIRRGYQEVKRATESEMASKGMSLSSARDQRMAQATGDYFRALARSMTEAQLKAKQQFASVATAILGLTTPRR